MFVLWSSVLVLGSKFQVPTPSSISTSATTYPSLHPLPSSSTSPQPPPSSPLISSPQQPPSASHPCHHPCSSSRTLRLRLHRVVGCLSIFSLSAKKYILFSSSCVHCSKRTMRSGESRCSRYNGLKLV